MTGPSPNPGAPPPSPTTLPPQPGYAGAAKRSGVPVSTSSNTNDVWGLGDLYGQQVFLGLTPGPVDTGSIAGIERASKGLNIGIHEGSYGTTQETMKHAAELWAAQTAEKAKYPDRLTSYERLQRSLWQAGFYGQTSLDSVHVGQWTTQTEQALVGSLAQYEQVSKGDKLPITFTEFLTQNAVLGQDGGKNSPGAGQAPTPQVAVTDPAAIRSAAQSAAQQALGRGLSEDQLSQFVSQFQAAQASAGTSTAAQVSAPSLGDQAMQFAQQTNPGDYKQNQRQTFMDMLVNLMGPSDAPRPNMTPVAAA